jgi:hypothetical protein
MVAGGVVMPISPSSLSFLVVSFVAFVCAYASRDVTYTTTTHWFLAVVVCASLVVCTLVLLFFVSFFFFGVECVPLVARCRVPVFSPFGSFFFVLWSVGRSFL